MSNAPNDAPIADEDLSALVSQLQAEEDAAKDATLSSAESLQAWILAHPMLRNAPFVENLAQVAPALLTMVRRLLGF
jgi:hypothetical protein